MNLLLQVILQILKDVSKTSSWKPGCLATSIISKPPDEELNMARSRGISGLLPVQHDIVIEETLPTKKPGFWTWLSSEEDGELHTEKMTLMRFEFYFA